MADDTLKYSDIITPDDSFEKLIKEIQNLNKSFDSMLETVQIAATGILKSLNKVNSATEQGRRVIENSAVAATRLEKAEQELAFAMSETGKQVAWLKSLTADTNKLTVAQQKAVTQAAGSYNKLKSELNESIALYRSLSDAEREDVAMGQALLQDILNYKAQLKTLNNQLNGTVISLSAVEKAEQKLAFAQSAEGQRVAELNAQTREANRLSVESAKAKQMEQGSYEAINNTLKQAKELYLSLSETNRLDPNIGGQLAQDIRELEVGLAAIRNELKPTATAVSEVDRAKEKLIATQTREHQLALEVAEQTKKVNKEMTLVARMNNETATSYDGLNARIQVLTSQYLSLSEVERKGSKGQDLANQIRTLKAELDSIKKSLDNATTGLTEVEKAEQKLIFLQSAEGQKLLALKEQIQSVINAHKQQSEATRKVTEAQQKLAFAQSGANQQLKLYSLQTAEANKKAELQARINNSAEGSYNRIAATYELLKIRLNALSDEQRSNTQSGRALEKQVAGLYARMRSMQEATGNYALSVGNYTKVWDGLGFSIAQVVRELPSAAINLNTLFLAVSNNIPMMVDEINKLRLQNRALAEDGKPTINITKRIVQSIFSWNTALVLILTAFSMFGDKIVDWVTSLFKGAKAAISYKEALKNVAEEIEKTNDSYGNNVVTLKQLSNSWKDLKTEAERKQWIKDNKSEFDRLGISINNINDAEIAFVEHTDALVRALQQRAKAAAAEKLAAEQYEKALTIRNKADLKVIERDKTIKEARAGRAGRSALGQVGAAAMATPGAQAASRIDDVKAIEEGFNKNIEALKDEAKAAEETAERYLDIAGAAQAANKEIIKGIGLDVKHRKTRERKGREPRDLTDTINKNQITLQRQYEESVTKLTQDEYAKRRKAAADQVQDANNKLREMYRKNVEYVNNVEGKYKALTEFQKEQIAQQQKWIEDTIANNLRLLGIQLQKIKNEQRINSIQLERETLNTVDISGISRNQPTLANQVVVTQNAGNIEKSLAAERALVEKNLDLEYALILDTNKKLRAEGDAQARSEEEILIELNEKKLNIWQEYDQKIFDLRKQNIEDALALVEKGSAEELNLLLAQVELERQIALSKNAAVPPEKQVSSETINAKFNKKLSLAQGSFELTSFDQAQKKADAEFNIERQNQTAITRFKLEQERDRWNKQIALAKKGGLDWSQAQIAAAEATVKGIDRQLAELNDIFREIGEKGLGQTLLGKLGFDDKQIAALDEWANIVMDNIKAIFDAEVELAEKQVELAEERVAAAQKAYDAEIEARNNGYANNVATAKKELQQEKKRQQEKEKILEAAKRRQEAIDTAIQASSLVTASANLWSVFSKEGPFGVGLALAAIATMWGSFAAAKIKAKQVTASADQEYGEGGLEFLVGGSHASGNDINLGVRNRRKRNMRAEGGEALAIINRRNTRKYKRVLPEVVNSLNKGTFEDKYLKAFEHGETLQAQISTANTSIDLSKLEKEVEAIKKQNAVRYYTMNDGTTVIINRNTIRKIK